MGTQRKTVEEKWRCSPRVGSFEDFTLELTPKLITQKWKVRTCTNWKKLHISRKRQTKWFFALSSLNCPCLFQLNTVSRVYNMNMTSIVLSYSDWESFKVSRIKMIHWVMNWLTNCISTRLILGVLPQKHRKASTEKHQWPHCWSKPNRVKYRRNISIRGSYTARYERSKILNSNLRILAQIILTYFAEKA